MKENELIELGFEKIIGELDEPDWYYYTYDFGNGSLSLISNASDELVDHKWVVEVFEDESIRFTSKIELPQFIRLVERNTVKK